MLLIKSWLIVSVQKQKKKKKLTGMFKEVDYLFIYLFSCILLIQFVFLKTAGKGHVIFI